MKYFHPQEFACPCCNQNRMQPGFLAKLDFARRVADVPFVVTSGFRCAEHNQAVGGVPDSAHTVGCAADIKVQNSRARYRMLYGLMMAEFNRIGIGKDFIHADDDPARVPEVVWLYER